LSIRSAVLPSPAVPTQEGPDDEALVLFAGAGGALRKLRLAKGKSHEDVAQAMGSTSPLTVRNWETPSAKPTLTTLDKYLRALGCTPQDFVSALPKRPADQVGESSGEYSVDDEDLVDEALRAAVVVLKRENDHLRRELATVKRATPALPTEAEASLSAVEEEMRRRRAGRTSDSPGSDDDPNAPSSTGGVS